MAISSSKWTIDQNTFGMSLDQLVVTQLPAWDNIISRTGLTLPQPSGYTARSIDDFSPDFAQDGTAILNIVPFSELDNIIQNGDVVVFMERSASLDVVQLMKQRGWHAEIAFRNAEGKTVQCAPWGEPTVQDHRCTELAMHRHYDALRWNLHIFRIAASAGRDGQIAGLLDGICKWRTIFHAYQFPAGPNWQFAPADFGDIAELEDIACRLIRSEKIPDMFCMQWVHAVLSLALNVPLNRSTLVRLGVLNFYENRWSQVGFLDEEIIALGRLPIVPYSQSDLVVALCTLYLGMSEPTVRAALPALRQMSTVQSVLQSAPSRTVLPISPFTEYRKTAHTGSVPWEYVATTFADAQCKLK